MFYCIIEADVYESFLISIKIEYYKKLLEEVKKNYDNNYEIPSFTDEEWCETLEKYHTLYRFIDKFCQNVSVVDRKILQKKYSEYLRAEQITEGKNLKRALVNYYDKLINASLRSIILSDSNSIDMELLNLYRSSNPLTSHDIERYLSTDQDLFMNKFVYKNMNIDKLTQLVYDRFIQYAPDIKNSTKLITGTEESKIDNKLKEVIKDTLQDMDIKMKNEIAESSTSVYLPTYDDISFEIQNRIYTTTSSGRVSVQPQFFSPTQPTTDVTSSNKKRKRSGVITKSIPSKFDAPQLDYSISPNKIKKIEKVKMEVKSLCHELTNMNKKVEPIVAKLNNELNKAKHLKVKDSDCYIISEDKTEVPIGEGLFAMKNIKKGDMIQFYNGKYVPYVHYSFEIEMKPEKGDYAIQVNTDIVYDCYENACIKDLCLASKANSAERLFCRKYQNNAEGKKEYLPVPMEYNAIIANRKDQNLPLFVIQATKDIKINEEILTMYTQDKTELFFKDSNDYLDHKNKKEEADDKNVNFIIDLTEEYTALDSFNSFMMIDNNIKIKDANDDTETMFESFQSLININYFIEKTNNIFPHLSGMFENNSKKMFKRIILDVACKSSDNIDFLTGLLNYFKVEQYKTSDEKYFKTLIAEIHLYHYKLVHLFNDYMKGNIFNSNEKATDIFKQKKVDTDLEIIELKLLNYKYQFASKNKQALFDSICTDIIQQSTNNQKIQQEVISNKKSKRNKSGYIQIVDDYTKIIKNVDQNKFIYHPNFGSVSDDSTFKPTWQQLLIRRKEDPDEICIEDFSDLISLKLKKEEDKSIYKLLGIENIFPHSNILSLERSSIILFHGKGWLNNYVIDRTIAMFMQHLQACFLKDPADDRVNRYQLFYTSKMYEIRPYSFETYTFLDEVYDDNYYQDHWYKIFQDLFDKEFLIYPCNMLNTHWFLIVVYNKTREIIYYDSFNIYDQTEYMNCIERSLALEAYHRGRDDLVDMNTKSFKIPYKKSNYKEMPQQKNGYDCGMFLLMLINFLIDGIPIKELKQTDMPQYRIILACDIIRQKMNYYVVDDSEDEEEGFEENNNE